MPDFNVSLEQKPLSSCDSCFMQRIDFSLKPALCFLIPKAAGAK